MVLKEIFKNVIVEENYQATKKHQKLHCMHRVKTAILSVIVCVHIARRLSYVWFISQETRQFTDIHFEDSSLTELKTVMPLSQIFYVANRFFNAIRKNF